MTVEDIDFASGRVIILHLKSRVWLNCQYCGGRLGLKHDFCPKCGSKSQLTSLERNERRRQRMLPLDNTTLDMVRNYIDKNELVECNGKNYLFNFSRQRAWQIIRECADKVGLPALVNPETDKFRGVSPHRLRDAFAVHAMKMDDSGEGMRLLQEHLGHASFNTTAKYRKIAGEEHLAWYQRLWNITQDSNDVLK